MEMHPTGEVSEYTATLAYELLREGEEGRQKVDSIKFVLRAEGNNKFELSFFVVVVSKCSTFKERQRERRKESEEIEKCMDNLQAYFWITDRKNQNNNTEYALYLGRRAPSSATNMLYSDL